ncbi:MAG: iron-containing alcohol dehydrogenase [Oscillospiraceae bacterium]|nr:iron-containing alcohol dehydrogenase [Oscillospiraceae bacterium]
MTNLFFNPVKVFSGRGCVGEYPWKSHGKKCMIVCGSHSARLCGALDDVRDALTAQNIKFIIFDRVEQNPTVETCKEAGDIAREDKVDFIIGIGGGSPLDAAKAAAYFASNPHLTVETLYDGECKSDPLPVIAIPTTAGTGSEVTQYSVLTCRRIENKKTLKTPKIFPVAALLDAEYTVTLPQSITNATAVDALCHAVEGYLSKGANPVSDALAEKAMFYVGRSLRSLIEGRLDFALRERLLLGSMLAGMVISVTGTCFVHSFGYPFTYFEGLSHGEANACFLPDFAEYTARVAEDKVMRVYRLCGVKTHEEFRSLIERAVPCDWKFDRDAVMKYSRIGGGGGSVNKGLYEPTADDIYNMYKKYII